MYAQKFSNRSFIYCIVAYTEHDMTSCQHDIRIHDLDEHDIDCKRLVVAIK